MDDKELRQLVTDELDFEPSVDAANIGVAAEKGVVTLTGHVGSYAEKIAAERAAQRVKGVKAIAQEIEVRYPAEKKTSDDQIAQRALSIIAWSAMIPSGALRIKVEEGWVTLEGSVEWAFQKQDAESAVRELTGVVGVINMVRVKQTARPEDVRDKIMNALRRDADIEADAIDIDVQGGKVVIAGKVHAWRERDIVERAAWSTPGVTSVEDRLTVG